MFLKKKKIVKLYLYLATHTTEKYTIDEYIWSLAKHKNKLIEQFEHALKENAIDGIKISDRILDYVAKIGEKIELSRYETVNAE